MARWKRWGFFYAVAARIRGMDQNPYDAPQAELPRSEAMQRPWLLTVKGIAISGAAVVVSCAIARYLTIALRLHDPANPWMVIGAIANIVGINLGLLVAAIGGTVWLIRWLRGSKQSAER